MWVNVNLGVLWKTRAHLIYLLCLFAVYGKLPIIEANEGDKTRTIQNILFHAFTGIHTLLYISLYITDIYFQKQFVMITCICDQFRLLLTTVWKSQSLSPPSSSPLFLWQNWHLSCAGSPVHTHHSVAILWNFFNDFFKNFTSRISHLLISMLQTPCKSFIPRSRSSFLQDQNSITEDMKACVDMLYTASNTVISFHNFIIMSSWLDIVLGSAW